MCHRSPIEGLKTLALWHLDEEGPNAAVWGGLITRARDARDSPGGNSVKKTLKNGNNDNKNGNSKNNGKDKSGKTGKLPYNNEVGDSEGLTDGTQASNRSGRTV